MEEDRVLTPTERVGLVIFMVGLFVIGITTDHRTTEAPRPDWVEYTNSVSEITVNAVELYFLLRIGRILRRLFYAAIQVLIRFGLITPYWWLYPRRPRDPTERESDDNANFDSLREKALEEIAARRDAYMRLEQKDAITNSIVAIALAIGFFFFAAWLASQHWSLFPLHRATQSAPANHRVSAPPHATHPCIPTYCQTTDGVTRCAIPAGSNPTEIARAMLPATATEAEVGALATRIVADNRAALRSRTDRQILPETPLTIGVRPNCAP